MGRSFWTAPVLWRFSIFLLVDRDLTETVGELPAGRGSPARVALVDSLPPKAAPRSSNCERVLAMSGPEAPIPVPWNWPRWLFLPFPRWRVPRRQKIQPAKAKRAISCCANRWRGRRIVSGQAIDKCVLAVAASTSPDFLLE